MSGEDGETVEELRGVSLLLHDIVSICNSLRKASIGDAFAAAVEYVYLTDEVCPDDNRDDGKEDEMGPGGMGRLGGGGWSIEVGSYREDMSAVFHDHC